MNKNRISFETPLIMRLDMYEELFFCSEVSITVIRVLSIDFDNNKVLIQTMDRKKAWVNGFWLHLHAIRLADLN